MLVAVISDIHANLAALEAVLADMPAVDEIWCLGDVVGYGPEPNECIEIVRGRSAVCVAGNHDWAVLGRVSTADFNPDAAAAIEWTASRLTEASKQYLASLPLRDERNDVTLVHGSPRDPIWEYLIFPSLARANLEAFATPICLVGHTHIPIVYACSANNTTCNTVDPSFDAPLSLSLGRYIINPGSIGQPRDGVPDSRYILLDLDAQTVLYRRVAYDITRTQLKMQQANLPTRLWMRLSYGW